MPSVLWTTLLLLAKEMNSGSLAGKMALALRGIVIVFRRFAFGLQKINSYDMVSKSVVQSPKKLSSSE
jgi:hypothetical protein